MVSRSRKISSSYSCPVCCPDSGPYEVSFNPNSITLLVDGFQATTALGSYVSCHGDWTAGVPVVCYNWTVENPAVISLASNLTDTNTVSGLSGGTSRFWAYYSSFNYFDDGMDCYNQFFPDLECEGDVQVKNAVELGNVNFSNPNPPVAPVGGTVTVAAPVAAAVGNTGATSCRVCIEPTEASAELVPSYPGGDGRCSKVANINPGATEGFTVQMKIDSAGPPLPMTFKAKGMVEVTNTNIAEVKGMNPKVTSNIATVQAP